LIVAVVTAGVATTQAQAPAADATEIETIPLRGGTAMLVGRGGNIGVSVGPDGAVLIDDQVAPLTEKIRAAVAALGATSIGFVINTHWHFDHTGGNENLGEAGTVIVAHANVRERMSVEQFMRALDRRVPASPPVARPVVTFTRDVTLHRNGHQIRVLHVPAAHTDGDALVHFPEQNVLHTGDVFIRTGLPFIDLDSGGSVRGLLAAIETAVSLTNEHTHVIPGHGPLARKPDLLAYQAMVTTIVGRIEAALQAGKDLTAVHAMNPVAGFEERVAGGFISPERFVDAVFASLETETVAE
jgi:glyoxylase-like metal-dependent hydrolase (beta-lactamase superfamily II)